MLTRRMFSSAFLQVKAHTKTCVLPERSLNALEAGREREKV